MIDLGMPALIELPERRTVGRCARSWDCSLLS
jgi:hypothetical protein